MHATTIEQTRSPLAIRLLNKSGAWLDKAGMLGAPLRAIDLSNAAKRRCGLTDFGEGDFFEPLSRLLVEERHPAAAASYPGPRRRSCIPPSSKTGGHGLLPAPRPTASESVGKARDPGGGVPWPPGVTVHESRVTIV